MKHADALAAVTAACKALRGAEIPTFAIFHDDDGWHLVGPQMAGDVLAEIFHSVADRCNDQLPPSGTRLN